MDNTIYTDAYGIWEVTTEGDCEGKTTRHLGYYEGYWWDIAMELAEHSYYSLCFSKLNERIKKAKGIATKENVEVSFAGYYPKKKNEFLEDLQKVINDNGGSVTVENGRWDNVFKLCKEISEEEKRMLAIEKAKSKLTPEEIQILGL